MKLATKLFAAARALNRAIAAQARRAFGEARDNDLSLTAAIILAAIAMFVIPPPAWTMVPAVFGALTAAFYVLNVLANFTIGLIGNFVVMGMQTVVLRPVAQDETEEASDEDSDWPLRDWKPDPEQRIPTDPRFLESRPRHLASIARAA